jgi:hypothetical protein
MFSEALLEGLKVLPGILLFPFSIYFAWKKIGNSVGVSFSYGVGGFEAPRVRSIVFTNKKDKPLPIFSAFLRVHKEIVVPVEKFDPPVVLKGLEVTQVETKPFSTYYLGNDEFELTPELIREAEFFVITAAGVLRCDIIGTGSDIGYAYQNDMGLVAKSTRQFNGHVYNDKAIYAISYLIDGAQRTAFVDQSGCIGGDWRFRYNYVPKELLSSASGINEFLKHCGYDKLFQGVSIDTLEHPPQPLKT